MVVVEWGGVGGGGGGGGGQIKIGGFLFKGKGGNMGQRFMLSGSLEKISDCCVDAHLCCFELFIHIRTYLRSLSDEHWLVIGLSCFSVCSAQTLWGQVEILCYCTNS